MTDNSKLPRRITVSEVLEARYPVGNRPVSWDERHGGFDTIRTVDGEQLTLASGGGQSAPAPGWQLLLMTRVNTGSSNAAGREAFTWTAYGMARR